MKPSSAKAKGRRFQQEIAKLIGDLLEVEVGPDCPVASREMGQSGPDIRIVGDLIKRFPYHVECKNQEKWNLPKWIKQIRDSFDSRCRTFLLFIRRNQNVKKEERIPPLVVLTVEEFFSILKHQKELEKEIEKLRKEK